MLKNTQMIYSNPFRMPRGDASDNLIPFINYHSPAPKRCLDMLLAKYHQQTYQTEVLMFSPDKSDIPNLRCPLSEATILLLTDGGLVPKGKPDQIPSTSAEHFGVYSIKGEPRLDPEKYEINHQGYDNSFVEQDPNRLLPLDALRQLEAEGIVGKIHDTFLSTTGVMCSTAQSKHLGQIIARYVSAHPIDAVIISSVCGTSTRCGSYIGMAIEEEGIPVVQITNLTHIAQGTKISRILKGNNICYPFGDPTLSPKSEFLYRKRLTQDALSLFTQTPEL